MTPSVLVVGDVMLDEYVVGEVERISPEAPVPVVGVTGEMEHLGGAANVARQVVALGGRAVLIGVVGDDGAGRAVRGHCASAGIDASGLVPSDRPTTRKQRVLAGRQQIVRLDRETRVPISGALEDAVVAAVDAALAAGPDVVVVSDYAKGVLTGRVLRSVVDGAAALGVPVLVDPKSDDLSRYRGATLLKANAAEFVAAAGRPLGGDPVATVRELGPGLADRAGIGHLMVTLGADGLVLLPAPEPPGSAGAGRPPAVVVPGVPRHVYDVSGAGDVVIATLAVLLASGTDLSSAASAANVAAGIGVQRPGVAVVTAEELAAELAGGGADGSRVVTRDELVRRREVWRAEGRRVVFTNGCFDLLHAGHVHLLRGAARLGDVLVVGVDDDASVRRLKGDGRPIVTGAERMALVAALDVVDAVVAFDTDELESLIRSVGPDVLVKGSDYATSEVVGGAWVEANGGVVELVDLLPDRSTSSLVDRIRGG